MPEVQKWALSNGWNGASSIPRDYLFSSARSVLDHDSNLPPPSQPTPVAR